MLIQRSKLPAFAKQESLMTAINSGQVTLITGETGSGKSTQVVQFIMDDLYPKVISQPKLFVPSHVVFLL